MKPNRCMDSQHLSVIKRICLFCIFLILSTGTLFFLLEIGARFIGFQPPVPEEYSNAFWDKHEELGYTAIPRSRWSFFVTNGDRVERKIGTVNSMGFRPVVTNQDCHDCPVLLFIGDSLTFCAESNDSETWPEFTAKYLKSRGHYFRCQNFSMRGYSTVQAYVALKEALQNVKNIHSVVYLFSSNDPYESIVKDSFRPRPMLTVKSNNQITISPPTFLPSWEEALEKNKYLGRFNHIKYNLALISLTERIIKPFDYAQKRRIPKIDVSDKGYRNFWNTSVKKAINLQFSSFLGNSRTQQGMKYILDKMFMECNKNDINFFVSFIPFGAFTKGKSSDEFAKLIGMPPKAHSALIQNWKEYGLEVKNLAELSGAIFLNINNCLDGMSYREYAAHPKDWHYSVAANKRIGEAIGKELLTNELF